MEEEKSNFSLESSIDETPQIDLGIPSIDKPFNAVMKKPEELNSLNHALITGDFEGMDDMLKNLLKDVDTPDTKDLGFDFGELFGSVLKSTHVHLKKMEEDSQKPNEDVSSGEEETSKEEENIKFIQNLSEAGNLLTSDNPNKVKEASKVMFDMARGLMGDDNILRGVEHSRGDYIKPGDE